MNSSSSNEYANRVLSQLKPLYRDACTRSATDEGEDVFLEWDAFPYHLLCVIYENGKVFIDQMMQHDIRDHIQHAPKDADECAQYIRCQLDHSSKEVRMEEQQHSSSASDAKQFISPDELHQRSVQLALKVARSGLKPTHILALWRGGAYTGAVVQEALQHIHGTTIDHTASRTRSRDETTGLPLPEVEVHAIGHMLSVLRADSVLLIVDDISDSGKSPTAVISKLRATLEPEGRMPRVIKLAVLFAKPKKLKFGAPPDFVGEETDRWIVLPHEIVELSDEEIKVQRPEIWNFIHSKQ